MKTFNRLLIFIFALLIGATSLVTLFMALGWTTPLDYLNHVFNSLNNRWVIGITSLFLFLAALYLCFRGFGKNSILQTKIINNDTGEISITLAAVEALVKKAAFQIKGVREVKPLIRLTPDGIAIFMKTGMQPGTMIPQAAEELQLAVKGYLEQTAGLKIVEIKVLITHVSQEIKSRVD